MVKILVNHKILIILAIMVISLAGCSDNFEKGQKVWVSIPGSSFVDEGYAIGTYVKRNKTRIVVKPSKVVSQRNLRVVHALRRGPTSVPAAWVSEYDTGRQRFQDVKTAKQLVYKLAFRSTKTPDQDAEKIANIAKQYELDELLAAVKVIMLRHEYFDKSIAYHQKIENIPQVLTKLEHLSKDNRTHKHLLNSQQVLISYPERKAIRTRILNPVPINSRTERKNKVKYSFFIHHAVGLIRYSRKLLNSSEAGGVEALAVLDNLDNIMKAESAYLNFMTNHGVRLRGQIQMGDVLAYRKKQIFSGLRTELQSELKFKHKFYEITSMDEAEEKYRAIMAEAGKIENQYGIKVYRMSDRNRLFIRPAKKRLSLLARDEEEVYLVATDYTLEPVNQKEMIDTYLRNYPNGKYRDRVKAELAYTKAREKSFTRRMEAKKEK